MPLHFMFENSLYAWKVLTFKVVINTSKSLVFFLQKIVNIPVLPGTMLTTASAQTHEQALVPCPCANCLSAVLGQDGCG